MDAAIRTALQQGGIADITTTGRKTQKTRRVEIYFHNLDGSIYVTGRPGKRGWYANLLADPNMVLSLKRGPEVDLVASAEPVTDPTARRDILWRLLTERFDVTEDKAQEIIDMWVEESPLVRVSLAAFD